MSKKMFNERLLFGMMFSMILFMTMHVVFIVPAYAEIVSVEINDKTHNIEYVAKDLRITKVTADIEQISLIFSINTIGPEPMLNITLERSFFDTVVDGQEYEFIILADGVDIDFLKTQPDTATNALRFNVPGGTEEIEIIGWTFGDGTTVPTPIPEEVTPTPIPEEVTPTPIPEEVTPTPIPEEVTPTPIPEEVTPTPIPPPEPPEEVTPTPTPIPPPEPPTEPPTTTSCGEGTVLEDGVCVLDQRCGEGTVLEDGVCVLDQRCGEGTVLEDGICVLEPSEPSSSRRTQGGDLLAGSVGAFAIAGAIAIGAVILIKISTNKRR